MANNKVYSLAEMQDAGIVTCDYAFMDKPGDYIGSLDMKAVARGGMLRLFLRLVDGRKIITPVFWWQKYLGFYEMDNGTRLRLVYGQSSKGETYLKQIEIL